MRRKFLRWVYGTLSFSTALFVFQACYGVRQEVPRVMVKVIVTDSETALPIEGINVESQGEWRGAKTTDQDGVAVLEVSNFSNCKIDFTDKDPLANGYYTPKDTTLQLEWQPDITVNMKMTPGNVEDLNLPN